MVKQVIFIHIPKTAGTSITEWMKKNGGGYQRRRPQDWDEWCDFTDLRHVAAGYYRKKYISQEWWDRSIKLAVVRNPWDRLVSLYAYLSEFRPRRSPKRGSSQSLKTFDLFARTVSTGRFVKPVSSRNVRSFSQVNPQVAWLKWGVDKVLRFETLKEDWRRFCDEIGKTYVPLPVSRTSKHRRYQSYYDEELVEIVGRYYQRDVDRFGYKFEREFDVDRDRVSLSVD